MNIKLSLIRSFLGSCLLLPLAAQSAEFSVVVIPDTQFYAETNPSIIDSQMKWVVDPMNPNDIVYVAHLGDIKDDGTCDVKTVDGRTEWEIVDDAFDILDVANVPYGLVPGNHDFDQIDEPAPTPDRCPNFTSERPLSNFNMIFGPARFMGDPWYGDPSVPTDGNRVGGSNEDNFTLVESNGVKFIFINLAYHQQATGGPEVTWADNLLSTYSDRLGVVTTHFFLQENPPIGSVNPRNVLAPYGVEIYSALSSNPNLFMMLSAHRPGEAWRTELTGRAGMAPTQILLSDYQDYSFPAGDGDPMTPLCCPNPALLNFGDLPIGGTDSGLMRIMNFDTLTGMVNINTFIPPETDVLGRTNLLPSGYTALSGDDMDQNTASNLSFSYVGYAPLSVFLDFETRQDGTAYTGISDSFPAEEYDNIIGVQINDTDPDPGSTFVNEINAMNAGTDISGYYANIGAFAATPQTQLTLDFTTAVTDVSFDFATTDGILTVTAFGAGAVSLGVFPINGTDPFINQAGFNVMAGSVDISGIGDIVSILVEPSLDHALIFDNLSYTTAVTP